MIRRLDSRDPAFGRALSELAVSQDSGDRSVAAVVTEIIADVEKRGNAALIDYTQRFDGLAAASVDELEVSLETAAAALDALPEAQRAALAEAARRIRMFHERQLGEDWSFEDEHGNRLGQRVMPLDRVGVYVPGGKASYPSSVLMNAIPASVAGVSEVVMVAPTPGGESNPLVLAAAALAGVDRIFCVGGAQAVAALALGSTDIPRVDKIVGPGNRYVAEAKRQVFGRVGIDMIAGPSEILVISDGTADPEWIAMDLFSQAEHDESAQAVLVSPSAAHLDAVEAAVERLLPTMPRSEIIRASLESRGALILARDLSDAAAVSNVLAPEHLELAVADPDSLLLEIRSAGAIFMGVHSCEALGDYCAGPNHVLPTAGTARFFSPLGVYDFQKRSSIIHCTGSGVQPLAAVAETLALGEALPAHARSAALRRSG
ncbi:MAG: histidinol dehydrogenase [Halieaceae bacterium]|jgi:histidinol dehydrogenase|nr:histidinol dehydrogenase [Halieaceae bacterium]